MMLLVCFIPFLPWKKYMLFCFIFGLHFASFLVYILLHFWSKFCTEKNATNFFSFSLSFYTHTQSLADDDEKQNANESRNDERAPLFLPRRTFFFFVFNLFLLFLLFLFFDENDENDGSETVVF